MKIEEGTIISIKEQGTAEIKVGRHSDCIACGACVAGCPSGALSIVDWDAVTSAAQAAYKDL